MHISDMEVGDSGYVNFFNNVNACYSCGCPVNLQYQNITITAKTYDFITLLITDKNKPTCPKCKEPLLYVTWFYERNNARFTAVQKKCSR